MPVNASSYPAPSAATIAAAVAAPSAATIATAVAAAVPTTAGITTIVQNNAGFGNTTTLLASQAANSATSVTLSWGGSYKILYVVLHNYTWNNSNEDTILRINSDSTTGAYAAATPAFQSTTQYRQSANASTSRIFLAGGNATTANGAFAIATISNATSTSVKIIESVGYGPNNGYNYVGNATYNGSSAVSSVQITTPGASSTFTNGTFYVLGVN